MIQLTAWRNDMIFAGESYEAQDSGAGYVSDGAVIMHLLKNKIKLPETSVADKEKIISAIEAREDDDKEKKGSLEAPKKKK
ncbi:MAG: hypothetical protein ACTHMD_11045 [Flavisolibacter sp.]